MKADPPAWALAAGLPPPGTDEEFSEYVLRLGLNPTALLEGLSEHDEELANIRLASLLTRHAPRQYDEFVDALVKAHVTPERRRELHNFRL